MSAGVSDRETDWIDFVCGDGRVALPAIWIQGRIGRKWSVNGRQPNGTAILSVKEPANMWGRSHLDMRPAARRYAVEVAARARGARGGESEYVCRLCRRREREHFFGHRDPIGDMMEKVHSVDAPDDAQYLRPVGLWPILKMIVTACNEQLPFFTTLAEGVPS